MEFLLVAVSCLVALALAWSLRTAAFSVRRGRLSAGRVGEDRVGPFLDEAGALDRLDGVIVGRVPRDCAEIDHLVRGRGVLVVVETKNWSGSVSGAADDRTWFLSGPGGEAAERRNPLHQAERQARLAARSAGLPRRCVRHVVAMAGRASAAGGAFPEGVVAARDLPRLLPGMMSGDEEDAAEVDTAWRRLVESAYAPGAERRTRRYSEWLEARFGAKPWRSWIVVSFALAALAFTMSMCMLAISMQGEGLM